MHGGVGTNLEQLWNAVEFTPFITTTTIHVIVVEKIELCWKAPKELAMNAH